MHWVTGIIGGLVVGEAYHRTREDQKAGIKAQQITAEEQIKQTQLAERAAYLSSLTEQQKLDLQKEEEKEREHEIKVQQAAERNRIALIQMRLDKEKEESRIKEQEKAFKARARDYKIREQERIDRIRSNREALRRSQFLKTLIPSLIAGVITCFIFVVIIFLLTS